MIKNQKGVTLIETLIYMGLLSIMLVTITEMFGAILDVKIESEAVSSVEQDGNYLLARFQYDINKADSITTPASPGDQGDTLVLDIEGTAHTYSLSGGNLQLNDTVTTSNLNGSETTISNLSFRKIGPPTGNQTVKIGFTVTSVAERNSGNEEKVLNTTVGTR